MRINHVKQPLHLGMVQGNGGKRFVDETELEKGFGRYGFSNLLVCQPAGTDIQIMVSVSKPKGKARSVQRQSLTLDKFFQALYRAFNRNQDILLNSLTRDFEWYC
jgi:hypothetical protein